jgi:hypothetical protein
MHSCEEFRERIAEYIVDQADLPQRDELLICPSCAEFYAQSREAVELLDQVDFSISDIRWNDVEMRLRRTLRAADSRIQYRIRRPALRWVGAFSAAAAALLLIIIGLYRAPSPSPAVSKSANEPEAVYVDRSIPLDPVTVDFLQQSELLLRSVMEIGPGDAKDLANAEKVATQQLPELEQRKQAAAAAPHVVRVMDTYETILRDLRNIDRRNAGEDIADIQKRIERNGLIAGIKAFQPNVKDVRYVLR